ncbi:hypothetical protein [Spirulina subsalsa]|uniref:NACHT C-terminal alpha/beta 1 domain-containing protein n=1 Tax=Spirulina subsalsa TaxID=54311 RepID=UPI003B5028F3
MWLYPTPRYRNPPKGNHDFSHPLRRTHRPTPQGFDIAVLNQLARFSHPPIAVIVPQPLPECRLPQFLESDPDLIANLLQWLQNLDR